MESSEENFSKTARRSVPTKQAWAAYVRQRWNGRDLVKACQMEWALSAGEARGVVYGSASQRTIDRILDHKNGGLSVELDVAATAWGISTRGLITRWIEHQRGRLIDERERNDAEARRMVALAHRLDASLSRRSAGGAE